jgi:hypothetical protein
MKVKMQITKSKLAFVFVFILAAATNLFSYKINWAEELLKEVDFSFDAGIGYHYADIDGYRGKVGEYEVLDPGMEGNFALKANTRRSYLDLEGVIKDKNDQNYMMGFDINRIFQTEASYSRFKHYLDHDPLSNQDFVTDFDAGNNNSIIVEEFNSENTFRVPFIPNLKIKADFRQYNKRGHRQATTVGKCTQCHVTSENRRTDQTTEDIDIGTEMKVGFLTFNYRHLQRSFSEGGSTPIAYYGYGASSFPVKGFDRYNDIPKSRTHINNFKVKADLPLQSDFYFTYEMGKNNNRETRNERKFESFVFRLTTAVLKFITFNFSYYDHDRDSNAPDSMDKHVRRSDISFVTRPWKRNFLRGSYRWEDIDRRNADQESTFKKVFKLSLFSRPHRKIDFNLRYRNETVDDPFLAEEWNLFRFTQTSVPTRSNEVQLSLNWNPKGNLSFSSTVSYEEAESHSYDIDEERVECRFSVWFAPRDDLILTGSYSLIDTDIDTRTAYKTYHRENLLAFLYDNGIPYDDTSNCYNFTINYRFSRKVALISNFTYIDSRSDFDSLVYGVNIGKFSDLHIERWDASVGLDYLYKPYLSLYTRYNYRDYNDREINELDGKAHLVSVGCKYVF